ncbi:MAG TPA: carboxypeptidase regulatory-like domain-containing protein [Candidatus Saccharimonadales bacterium]|nr:carboxypeptidase regulatory-like domain-containing protein [Candidatus Saccharimonadales bacterium]
MPDKEKMNRSNTAGSAPELPHEIAKEYGLHKEGVHPTAPKAKEQKDEAPKAAEQPHSKETGGQDATEDPKTDAAVDDILAKESDQLLAIQDGGVPHYTPPANKRGHWGKVGHFFAAWWQNKWARWITIIVMAAAIAVVFAIPKARYAVLNTVGVRSSASVVVLDNTTKLPLKNVTVTLDGKKVLTDREGKALFSDLRLGEYTLTIKRIAFAPHTQHVTIGWGSNPLGSFKIKATGIQYVLSVTDYVSGKPIAGAEAVSDENNALSDKDGKIILTVEDTDVTTLDISVSAPGYRPLASKLDAAVSTATSIVLVPAVKEVFVSNQSGRYDVYTVDLDGQNKKLVLAGTGNESSNISLAVSPDGKRAALVSTRDNLRDEDGYILQALTIINLDQGTGVTVDHAEQLQLIDWVGNRLVYRITLAGASAANGQRSRIISFDYDSNARIQLATANQFNAALSVDGIIYYAASSTDPEAALGLFKVKADGTSRKRFTQDEVWTALRANYTTLNLQTPDGWQALDIAGEQLAGISQPGNLENVPFITNPKGTVSLWSDIRDGKAMLFLHDIAKKTDKTLAVQDGMTQPMRWVSDELIIYRVTTNAETADYVVSTRGGSPHKLTDVSTTYGFAQIY